MADLLRFLTDLAVSLGSEMESIPYPKNHVPLATEAANPVQFSPDDSIR